MSEKTVVEILEGGLSYLRTNGWTRGEFGYTTPGDTCKACALGAIYAGAGEHAGMLQCREPNTRIAVDRLLDEVPGAYRYRGVPYFNDNIAKRRRDVERLFARAIKKAKAA